MQENRIQHYFVDANSSQGYVSLSGSNFGPLERVVDLHGFPPAFMEKLVDEILRCAQAESICVEVVHNCMDNSPEGVLLPGRGVGLRNIPAYREKSGLYLLDGGDLQKAADAIAQAHREFASALKIHDEWEKVYISSMDFGTADRMAGETADMLLQDRKGKRKGRCVHRFFGAATVNGAFDYIADLTKGLQKRWFLKGRPGTGKSTFLRRIAARAEEAGFCTEVYHCSFDPSSLDMIIVRELGFCVFDSTAPHEYFPGGPEDEIIDLYAAAVAPGTDERNRGEIARFQASYKAQIAKATACLRMAKECSGAAERACFGNAEEGRLRETVQVLAAELFAGT